MVFCDQNDMQCVRGIHFIAAVYAIYICICVENFNNRHLFANSNVWDANISPLYCLDYSQVTRITINGNPPHPGVCYHYCRGSVLGCDSQRSVPDEYIHDRINLAGLRWVTVMYCSKLMLFLSAKHVMWIRSCI